MVHYHFRDRDQLIDAVVEECLVPLIRNVWGPTQSGQPAAELVRGLVERLLDQIECQPWVPSTWMREILNEGGLLRERLLRRLPLDRVRIVGRAVALGQAQRTVNPDIDPILFVFSTLGLVMVHMATIRVWGQIFHRQPPTKRAMQRHIVSILLQGLGYGSVSPRSRQIRTHTERRKA